MPEYRRADIPGALYFFTVVTFKRRPILISTDARKHLRDSFERVKSKHPFSVEAIVLLPDHIHTIWLMPEDDADFARRWNEIKGTFSRKFDCGINGLHQQSASRLKRHERCVWQRRYWEHCIRDEKDFQRHLEYIHYNPVKHGHATAPKEWEWSSFHRYVRKGWYDIDWGDCGPDAEMEACAGEPGS